MKFSFKKLIVIFLILIIGLSLTIFLKRPNLKKKVVINDYINISNLTNEFMEEYVDNVRNIESSDKENILIVTSLEKISNDYGAVNIIEAPNNQYFLQYDSKSSKDNAYKKLKQDSNIIVEENYVFYLETETNTNYNSWGVEKLGFDDVINNIDPNSLNEITVAVIDSGVHFAEFNQYYEGRIEEVYDLHYPETTIMTDSNPTEHGTHIAGTIAETTPENVKILPVKVTDKNKSDTADDAKIYLNDVITVINAITSDKKADVISMSFGAYDLKDTTALSTAITAANDENIICVASAGNKSISNLHYPSSLDNVISVSAVDIHLEKTCFSSYGETINFAAPGWKIKSFTKDPNNALKHGTSMATPHVASAVAILKSFNKNLDFDDTMTLLKKNAIDIGDDGFDEYYGYGVINFNEAKFCNKDVTCDQYGVFELDDTNTLSTLKIESPNIFVPTYNYGNITNIMSAEINLYYTNDDYYTKSLGQLIENIEIIGYDPYDYKEQEITIKYNDLETTMIVDNSNLNNGWDYELLDDNTIKLTKIYYNPNVSNDDNYEKIPYPQSIYIPNELDGKKISILGNNLFNDMDRLKRVMIPNVIKEIESSVFGKTETNDIGLINIIIPDTVSYISDDTFKNNNNIILYTIKNSYAYDYSINKQLKNMYIDNINISLEKRDYKAFEIIDKNKLDIVVSYDGIKQLQEEIKKDNYIIKYSNNNDSFRVGDNKFNVLFNTKLGYQIEEKVSVNVEKITPDYTIPDNIVGVKGNTLESIKLPDGFIWKDNSIILDKKGIYKFYANYIPIDNINYETIYDIEIPVLVENKIIVPKFDIEDITYSGANEIPIENIKIENLDASDYEIISTNLDDTNVGSRKAQIKIRLTDEKFVDFSLENGLQEYEYEVNVNIIPEKLKKPILWESKIYNGEEQEAEIYGFQESKMNITGNFRTEVGEHEVIISLKNNNYIWEDNTKEDLLLKFIIEKQTLNIDYNSSGNIVKYDGNYYGINLEIISPSNIKIKYMDQNGEYTLDEMPKYKEIGEYIIKFKLYIDKNYTDIIKEETLKIISNSITNNTKDYEGFYDGKEHSVNIDIDVLDYDIKYSINNKNYNLNELPKFKNVGEYTINYKITSPGYDDLISSNKVIIYGIKEFDQSLKIKDNIIVTKNNSFSNLTNKIKVFSKNTLYSHYSNNNLITSDIIKTGENIKINLNNSLDLSYLITVLGDVNSDGKISSADYIKIRKHIMETEKINNNIYFYSADINNDNKISSADYIKIKRYIMKGESL